MLFDLHDCLGLVGGATAQPELRVTWQLRRGGGKIWTKRMCRKGIQRGQENLKNIRETQDNCSHQREVGNRREVIG